MKYVIKRNDYDTEYHRSRTGLGSDGDETVLRLFSARGVTSEEETVPKMEHIPKITDLKNAQEAARMIIDAIRGNKKIFIVADYDTDGATACALAVWYFRHYGIEANYIVPDRNKDGYGLSVEIVEEIANRGGELIITVDNGINCVDEAARCKALGIPLIITDHHLASEVIPDALVVNPNQPGCEFPSKNIAGVGVIWFVLANVNVMLFNEHDVPSEKLPNMYALLDLVALGTVSDLVPMDKVNRALVNLGMEAMREKECCPGIIAIARQKKVSMSHMTTTDISFSIAPTLNAAGRMASMKYGIDCLLARTPREASELADVLTKFNNERQSIQKSMAKDAISQCKDPEEIIKDKEELEKLKRKAEKSGSEDPDLAAREPYSANSVFSPLYHIGIIGIIASKLVELNHLPSVVFTSNGDNMLVGSCRSVPGVNVKNVFDRINEKNPGLLEKYGGHSQAAGVTLAPVKKNEDTTANFERFKRAFNHECLVELESNPSDEIIVASDGSLSQYLQMESPTLSYLAAFIRDYPWGKDFELPQFDDVFAVDSQRLIGGGGHLELILRMGDGIYRALRFHQTQTIDAPFVRIVYQLNFDRFRGQTKYMLLVNHMQESSLEEYLNCLKAGTRADSAYRPF